MAVMYSQNGAIVRQVASFTGEIRLVNIMPTTGVKVVDDNGYIGGDFLGVYYPSTNYYNNFAIQLVGADFSDKGLGQVTIVDNTATIGGRVYRTVTIGGVTWLAENLDYKFSGCGIGGNYSSDAPNAWYYDNNEINYGIDGTRKCGLLYNWYAVKLLNTNRSELIPGWHIPTIDEETALANAVGGTSVAGTRLKALDGAADGSWPTSWNGTDDYGFGILPAGDMSSSGIFESIGSASILWSSSEYSSGTGKSYIFDTNASMRSTNFNKHLAGSVRLVKDS